MINQETFISSYELMNMLYEFDNMRFMIRSDIREKSSHELYGLQIWQQYCSKSNTYYDSRLWANNGFITYDEYLSR